MTAGAKLSTRLRAIVIALAVIGLVFVGRRNGYLFFSGEYQTATLDTVRLTLRVSERVGGLLKQASRRHFRQFSDAVGGQTIADCEPARPPSPQVCYAFFSLGPHSKIELRSRNARLMHGSFGTVYAKTTYYYDPRYDHQPNQIEVRPYSNAMWQQLAAADSTTAPAADLTLHAIAIVRIFRAAPQYLIAAANYDTAGKLASLSVDGVEAGDWSGDRSRQTPRDGHVNLPVWLGDRAAQIRIFGIPTRFPVAAYRARDELSLPRPELAEVITAIQLLFDEGYVVRQEYRTPGASSVIRTLRFGRSPEGAILGPLDLRRGFGPLRLIH